MIMNGLGSLIHVDGADLRGAVEVIITLSSLAGVLNSIQLSGGWALVKNFRVPDQWRCGKG